MTARRLHCYSDELCLRLGVGGGPVVFEEPVLDCAGPDQLVVVHLDQNDPAPPVHPRLGLGGVLDEYYVTNLNVTFFAGPFIGRDQASETQDLPLIQSQIFTFLNIG